MIQCLITDHNQYPIAYLMIEIFDHGQYPINYNDIFLHD